MCPLLPRLSPFQQPCNDSDDIVGKSPACLETFWKITNCDEVYKWNKMAHPEEKDDNHYMEIKLAQFARMIYIFLMNEPIKPWGN